jgi:peptidoglycan hydrolase CwlO-like protein
MSPIDVISQYWQILSSIVIFIVGYFKLRYDVESLQHSDISQEAKIESLQQNNQEIRENIATIRQKIDNTDNNINDIRRVLERLDERLHK